MLAVNSKVFESDAALYNHFVIIFSLEIQNQFCTLTTTISLFLSQILVRDPIDITSRCTHFKERKCLKRA